MLPACCLKSQSSLRFPSSRNPELFLHRLVTLAWLQAGRLRLSRYQTGACWGPATLKAAPGGLSRGSISSAALPAHVCAHVALPYHTPADLHAERNSFPPQAPYFTFDI